MSLLHSYRKGISKLTTSASTNIVQAKAKSFCTGQVLSRKEQDKGMKLVRFS